jgi:hypothetical protein
VFNIYAALGFLVFALIWRTSKYNDVPRRDHIYYRHPEPSRRPIRQRVTVWINTSRL